MSRTAPEPTSSLRPPAAPLQTLAHRTKSLVHPWNRGKSVREMPVSGFVIYKMPFFFFLRMEEVGLYLHVYSAMKTRIYDNIKISLEAHQCRKLME